MLRRQAVIFPQRFSSFLRTLVPGSVPAGVDNDKNLVPRMLAEPLAAAINEQINREHCASYVYRSMSYHFAASNVCLLGLADFYRKLAAEESAHAELLADVLLLRNGTVALETIDKPPVRQWSANLGETLCETMDQEIKLSHALSLLYEAAERQRDVVLMDTLTTRLLRPQCESMRMLQQLTTLWNRLQAAPDGAHRFDREVRQWSVSSEM